MYGVKVFELYYIIMDKNHVLTVYNCDYNKKRIGSKNDGGYIVFEIPNVTYDCLLSCGIENNLEFEEHFLNEYPNILCYAFDGTIDKLNSENNRILWIKKNIANYNSTLSTNLHNHLEINKNIFLKMDIEGFEYSWLNSLNINYLNNIAQIVIEFHWPYLIEEELIFKKLNETHVLVHLHGNNFQTTFTKDNITIPKVFECTYINKKYLPDFIGLNISPLPCSLNTPCNLNINDIDLNYEPFVFSKNKNTQYKIEKQIINNNNTNNIKIPKILFQTSKEKQPEYVINLLRKQLPSDWKYIYFNDKDIINYMKNNPLDNFPYIIDKFNSIKNGAHKADLFRLYYIYINGGVFLDSDAMLYTNINNIIKDYEFISVSGLDRNLIFQGFLGACKGNQIIFEALQNLYNISSIYIDNNYWFSTTDIYKCTINSSNLYKLYKEFDENSISAKTLDEYGNILLIHYWKNKTIPDIELSNNFNEIIEYESITDDENNTNYDDVVIAILAKDKANTLPFYLKCILNQTYPKNKIHLYIRTNDNTDNTNEILDNFVKTHDKKYASIYFDNSSISNELKQYKSHEWNTIRFKILGKIRQESIEYAIKNNAHYFVIDCDNFILPNTLEEMVNIKYLNVIAPMLVTTTAYSNYHYDVDNNGYLKDHEMYLKLLNKEVKGIIEVKVVHCTYFINNIVLNKVSYDDDSYRYEYVIFSDSLRKSNIPQYLDNRKEYGYITFTDTKEEFLSEFNNFNYMFN